MLQTIYEGESSSSNTTDDGHQLFLDQHDMHNVNNSVDIKPEVPLDPASPLDLRTDLRMLGPGSDPGVWERQLQQELLLIQKQQQIQKQLLISEFQKQHENLTRQHQAQLQEHLKELQAMKQQQQEMVEKERRLEQQSQQEKEQERHRREQHVLGLSLRGKERARESLTGAVASNEVKQKLQEFLLSKSNKDLSTAGATHTLIHHPKLWYTSSHHTHSLDQSSSPLGGMSPNCQYTLPSPQDSKDDFPLRKTASEPNLKVKSRLKQKVAERRSSPLLKRKDGNITTPYKKRALEMMDSKPTSSAPGSGPSSPIGASSALGAENGPSSLPTTTKTERWPSQPRLFRPEGSMSNLLSLYTSPSLPNITLGLSSTSSPISAAMGLKEKSGEVRHGLPGQLIGPVPMPTVTPTEAKVSPSHQALLQHLLQKEQMRQQKILSSGQGSMPAHPHSPLAMKDRLSANSRPKLPKHRPLNRTQSAPLPQSTLAQLVIQQQHQHFLEKQKQYHQQIHINKLLSKSIEQLRQPGSLVNPHLQESEEEAEEHSSRRTEDERMDIQEDRLPPGGVIRKHTLSSSSNVSQGEQSSVGEARHRLGVIKVKEEPIDSEDESLSNQTIAVEQSAYLHQVKGRLVIRAMI
ncbi:histone deacetylase 9-B isoform X2 [Esox lucius]|uniref:histone deacetylase 9-B isoform X2 n=1 Tax=Esox lucius TaxID=8010 RepID=UPI00147777B7|nr:histone deacetylase 9-B isoform X2 [Esox lucius]